MSIEEKQTCNMHTKEKEKSGTCCLVNDDQEKAEQLTYEQSFLIKTVSVKNSEIQYSKNIEGTKSCTDKGAERS